MKAKPLLLVLALLVMWKIVRADWIVECEYAVTDFHPPVSVEKSVESYTPPVSPLWNPPTPSSITGLASSTWGDWRFFAAGGSYGPTTEPALRFHWQLSLAKIVGVYLLVLLGFKLCGLPKRRPSPFQEAIIQ
jgi:hypothetical protein